ncbi:MAG: DoxX family protein [Microthrixaceae bacterium]
MPQLMLISTTPATYLVHEDSIAALTTASVGLLILRVALGVTIAAHGYGKFFRGGRLPGTANWFDSIGMKPGKVHALAAASTEVGAGLLFAAGLLTSVASAGFCALMLVAAWTVHRKNGFFIVASGWEYNFVLAIVAIGVATIGPGRFSLDHALDVDTHLDGWVGLLISAVGGLAAGTAQLVAFFRPPASADS